MRQYATFARLFRAETGLSANDGLLHFTDSHHWTREDELSVLLRHNWTIIEREES